MTKLHKSSPAAISIEAAERGLAALQGRVAGISPRQGETLSEALQQLRVVIDELQAATADLERQTARRRRAEEALQRSEVRFRRLAESNIIGVAVADIDGPIIEANATLLHTIQRSRQELQAGQVRWDEITPPEQRHLIQRAARQLRESAATIPWEQECFRADGSRVPVLVGATLLEGSNERYLAFVLDLTLRNRAEEELKSVAAHAHCILWHADVVEQTTPDGGRFLWSGQVQDVEAAQQVFPLEVAADANYDEAWYRSRHPDDSSRMEVVSSAAIRERRGSYTNEFRCTNRHGEERWLLEDVHLESQGPGRWRAIGVCTDITERKQAEQARQELLRKLVTVQEEERGRVARELHDQMGQYLTALLLGLKSLQDSHATHPEADRRIERLQQFTDQLMQEVQRLSWELRPVVLDDWGLDIAVQRYVAEWKQHSGIPTDFHSSGFGEERLAANVETTIYRLVQEALTNVLRHARARHTSVVLERRRDHLLAIVEDDGQGFLVEAVLQQPDARGRLGLLGMQERLALVDGSLHIESTPEVGTTVYIRVPLNA